MIIKCYFSAPSEMPIYSVDGDTRDLIAFPDGAVFENGASAVLHLIGENGTEEIAGTVHTYGSALLGNLRSEIVFDEFTTTEDKSCCVEVTEDGKTITSFPFGLKIERSLR